MTTRFTLKTSLIMVALLALPLAQAATISKTQYKADKASIRATYKSERAACAPMVANAKDICIEQARAKQDVAQAELTYSYTGKPSDLKGIATVKAKSAYSVAKEKCDDASGNAKDVCIKEAKAVETKALADIKLDKKVEAAKTDATDAKRDADYKVAAEKCDAMTGDAKSACISAAKARFGKS